jgi:hypothetical protein
MKRPRVGPPLRLTRLNDIQRDVDLSEASRQNVLARISLHPLEMKQIKQSRTLHPSEIKQVAQ